MLLNDKFMRTNIKLFLTAVFFACSISVWAQQKTISGQVTDSDGFPVADAYVYVEGTENGVYTNENGSYTLNVNEGDNVAVEFIGLETKMITVGNANNYNVSLSQGGAIDLAATVVTGAYGIEKYANEITYAAEQVTSEELNVAQPTEITQGLAGKVSGVNVAIQSNGVNPQTQINMRGIRSISLSSQPLYIIDGQIASVGAFNNLSPVDVESMDLIKGPSASALYGSDAANGVVIVKTKQGKKSEKITVGVNSTLTIDEVSFMPEFQNEYGSGWQGDYDPIENTNWGPAFDGQPRQIGPTLANGDFQLLPYSPIEDNLLDFYNTGTTYQNTLYAFSGDESSNYYASVTDLRANGVMPRDEYRRNTFKFNASKKLGKIKLSASTMYARDKTSVVGDEIGSQNRTIYWFILNTASNIPLRNYRDWRNNVWASPNGWYNGYYQNPYWAIDTNRDNDETNRLIGNISADWEIKDWLTFTTRFGVNNVNGSGLEWRDAQDYTSDYSRPDPVSSFVEEFTSKYLQYTSEALLSSNFNISDALTLKSIVGANNYSNHYKSLRVRGNNLAIPEFYAISNRAGELQGTVSEERERYYGFFGDFTLTYNDYLSLHLSGRQEWVSTLPLDVNDYFYPSVGLSFVASDAFDLNKDFISYLKFTTNATRTYNRPDPLDINQVYRSITGFPFGNISGFGLGNTAVDAGIKPEKNDNFEVGIASAFFNNKVTFDASYYTTKIEDLLTSTSAAPSSGSYFYYTNIGELSNKGYELALGLKPVDTRVFDWDLKVNYSKYETVVEDLDPNDPTVTETSLVTYGGGYGVWAIEGMAMPQIKAISYERDPEGRIIINPNTGNPIIGDEKVLGQTLPKYTIGLVNNFKISNFNISATFDYRTGHVYYSQLADAMEFTGRSLESVSANRQDFIIPNSVYEVNGEYVENTNIPVSGGQQTYWTDHYNEIKENYVKDATALKLREVAISYTIPNKYIESTGISKLTVGLVGRNLLTWLPEENRYADPEFNNSFTNSNTFGISGYFQPPPTRSYGFTVNFEF